MKQLIKSALQRFGFDLVRIPHPYTLEHHLQRLIRSLRIDCLLDVGAERGNYAAKLREFGYQGQIFSFEPVSET